MKALVPVYSELSKDKFVDAELIAPTNIGDTDQLTSFLKFDQPLDLIGATASETTESIDPGVSLAAIAYKNAGGTVNIVDITNQATNAFTAQPAGNFADVELNYTAQVSDGGAIAIYGKLNLQLGHLLVQASGSDGITPLGYKLAANLVNLNRQPIDSEKLEEIVPDGLGETADASVPDDASVESALDADAQLEEAAAASSAENDDDRAVTLHEIEGVTSPIIIEATDEKGSGGAYHRYEIAGLDLTGNRSYKAGFDNEAEAAPTGGFSILFQNGPIPEFGVNGITIEQLLAISGHRLQCFQAGPFASDDNQEALDHIMAAIAALNRRTLARIARGVEGKEVA